MIHVLNQYKLTRISVIFTGIQPWTLLEQPIREEAAIAGVEIHGVYQVTSNMSTTAFTRMFAHIKRTAQGMLYLESINTVIQLFGKLLFSYFQNFPGLKQNFPYFKVISDWLNEMSQPLSLRINHSLLKVIHF